MVECRMNFIEMCSCVLVYLINNVSIGLGKGFGSGQMASYYMNKWWHMWHMWRRNVCVTSISWTEEMRLLTAGHVMP